MTTGLAVFDTTLQETNEWLKSVQARLWPCDRQQGYAATRAVLHALRDRLPVEAVLSLSAQLPMLMRGVFLEGWRPADGPTDIRHPDAFAEAVAQSLPAKFPRDARETIHAVFRTLARRLDTGEVEKIKAHLPAPLRTLWRPDDRAA